MYKSRREFIASTIANITGFGLLLMMPDGAQACLYGKWKVRCHKGHDDIVEDVTCNHTCEKCGDQALTEGSGSVVCPQGHPNVVSTGTKNERDKWLRSYKCRQCGMECCIN
ncbi:MAG: hypothetical protein JWO13_418 [Acidobacteriales bacterium]|nr:hypothetical protein [Terriglobales bacterium]